MMDIQAQLQKEMKTIAKKKLYFSLALLYQHCHQSFSEMSKAMQAIQEAQHSECDCGNCANIANKILPEVMERHITAFRPVYSMTQALQAHKLAFGEFPEFVKFITKDQKDETVQILVDETAEMMVEMQGIYDKIGKKAKVKTPNLQASMFGKSFIDACEKIKIQGEA